MEAVNDFMEEARTEEEQKQFFKGICEAIVHDFQVWLGYTDPIPIDLEEAEQSYIWRI